MSYNYGDVIFVPSGSIAASEIGSVRMANPGPNPYGVSNYSYSKSNPLDYLVAFYSGLFHIPGLNITISG